MARPRKNAVASALPQFGSNFSLNGWAEQLGEALGRGMARGINAGLSAGGFQGNAASSSQVVAPRRRGRPPKALAGGPVPADRQCKVSGCGRPARSKGLCSAHYQAERRKQLQSKSA